MKTFGSIKYIGGLAGISVPQPVTLTIDEEFRRIKVHNFKVADSLNFEQIIEVSLNEKTTRSAGRTAAGALIGGVLTGGIGLIAGAAIGAKKSDAGTLYISYNVNGHPMNLMLKSNGLNEQMYAAITSAIAAPIPKDFDYTRPVPEKLKMPELSKGGCLTLIVLLVVIVLLYTTCNK